jgi:hypothetical protein
MNLSPFNSNPSALFKTKVFSLSSLLLCSLILVGCESSDDDAACDTSSVQQPTIGICTADQFYNATRNNPSGEYKLLADIDLSGYPNWTPIGDETSPFNGTLDGNGKTISSLKFKNTNNARYTGLFGYIDGAQIKNLSVKVTNINTISLTQDDDQYFGVIAGYAVGANLTKITVYSTATLTIYKNPTGDIYVGGIAGVANSTSTGKSTSSVTFNVINDAFTATTNVGGIVGFNDDGTISNSYTTGDISVIGNKSTVAGGIAGHNANNATISTSYASGVVFASDPYEAYAGGIAGVNNNATIGRTVALNQNITASARSTHIARRIAYGGELINNFALYDMTLIGGNYTINDNAYDSEDGANKTLKELQEQTTYRSGLGWDFNNTWDLKNGRPILR